MFSPAGVYNCLPATASHGVLKLFLESPLSRLAALLLTYFEYTGGIEMFSDMSLFDSLLDEFWGSGRNLRELGGVGSPWVSGVRSVSRGTFPPINIGASPDSVHVYVFAAGLDPQTLDLSLQKNLLTLSAQRSLQGEDKAVFYRRELFEGPFQRVITLPEDVNPDAVEAEYKNGILHVKIGRREEVRPKQIEIH
jgi:HSP20 family protein